jgi:hypothetical protein
MQPIAGRQGVTLSSREVLAPCSFTNEEVVLQGPTCTQQAYHVAYICTANCCVAGLPLLQITKTADGYQPHLVSPERGLQLMASKALDQVEGPVQVRMLLQLLAGLTAGLVEDGRGAGCVLQHAVLCSGRHLTSTAVSCLHLIQQQQPLAVAVSASCRCDTAVAK